MQDELRATSCHSRCCCCCCTLIKLCFTCSTVAWLLFYVCVCVCALCNVICNFLAVMSFMSRNLSNKIRQQATQCWLSKQQEHLPCILWSVWCCIKISFTLHSAAVSAATAWMRMVQGLLVAPRTYDTELAAVCVCASVWHAADLRLPLRLLTLAVVVSSAN